MPGIGHKSDAFGRIVGLRSFQKAEKALLQQILSVSQASGGYFIGQILDSSLIVGPELRQGALISCLKGCDYFFIGFRGCPSSRCSVKLRPKIAGGSFFSC